MTTGTIVALTILVTLISGTVSMLYVFKETYLEQSHLTGTYLTDYRGNVNEQ